MPSKLAANAESQVALGGGAPRSRSPRRSRTPWRGRRGAPRKVRSGRAGQSDRCSEARSTRRTQARITRPSDPKGNSRNAMNPASPIGSSSGASRPTCNQHRATCPPWARSGPARGTAPARPQGRHPCRLGPRSIAKTYRHCGRRDSGYRTSLADRAATAHAFGVNPKVFLNARPKCFIGESASVGSATLAEPRQDHAAGPVSSRSARIE